ncbi:hypothetical protein QL285_065860 [Trifolium repens]|nr:hypothetical protein QL285_065860 [Trifolium repens]
MSSELDELGKTGVFLALAFPDALPRGALDEEAPFFFFTGRVLGLPTARFLLSLISITENQKKESRTKKEIKMKRSDEGKRMKGLLFISGKITKT